MFSDIIAGIGSLFRAGRMLAADARLRRLALVPFLLNVAVVVVGVPLLVWLGVSLLDDLVPGMREWNEFLRVLVSTLFAVVLAVSGFFLLLVIGRALAAPFISRLSEAVEDHYLGDRAPARASSLRGAVTDAARGLGFALGRAVMFLILYPPIFLLSFIPVVGAFLFPVVAFLYGALALSLDFTEPVFDRYLHGFRNRLRYILGRKARYLGFGGGAVAMMLIPFVNLLILPVCAAAATLLFLDEKYGRETGETPVSSLSPNR